MHLKHTYGRKNFVNLDKSRELVRRLYKNYYGDQDNLTIIDAYPGIGVFSQALNEELRPRKHFLLEPFLAYHSHLQEQSWVNNNDNKNVYLSKEDPFRWTTFLDLAKQHPLDTWPRKEPHKTLIYHANLTAAQGEQLATQYLNCTTNQSWLQRFGRVKMLLWVKTSTAKKLLAEMGTKARSRVSVQRESCCSGVSLSEDLSLEKSDIYPPGKMTSASAPVLIDLTPHEKQVDYLDSFEYVIKMLFILKNHPLKESLNNLGPGAADYIGPKLSDGLLDRKPSEMQLKDFEEVTKVFEFWPFKPSFLHDFYDSEKGLDS